jgi:outer membrane protein assembly factor BamB
MKLLRYVFHAVLVVIIIFFSYHIASGEMFVSPVGSGFVETRSFMSQAGTQRHTGVDLASAAQPEGASVFAIADGAVVFRQDSTNPNGWGHMLRIRHEIDGQFFYSQYAHLQAGSLLVNIGDMVDKGEEIGRVDCTGRTEGQVPCTNGQQGPHLHFEIKLVDSSGCGYLPSTNCQGDSFINYFDPLEFIAGRNVYVSSFSEGKIYKVDKKSGAKIAIASGFGPAEDMTVDSNGVLYIGGVFQGVKRVDTNSNIVLSDVGVNVCGPEGPSLSPDGHLLVNTRFSPCNHSGVWIISAGTATTGVQVTPPFSGWGEGTVFLRGGPFNGHLIASDSTSGRIVRIPPEDFGNLLKTPINFITGLCVPVGITINSQSEVFISDPCPQEIRKYEPSGLFKQVFTSGLNGPLFMEFDNNNNLYVAHWPSGELLKFLPSGGRALFFPGGELWETNVPQSVGVAIRND